MWSNAYIGLPWRERGRDRDGLDCWGLARLVLAEQCGMVLPSYAGDYASIEEREDLAALIADQSHRLVDPVDRADVRPFDLVLMRYGVAAMHVGVVVEPGRLLHIRRGARSEAPRYDRPLWPHPIASFWRVPELP